MKAALQVRFSQHLALTPQLQQSIRLLQLSTLELNQEIEQALADNPLLERHDDPLDTPLRIAGDGSIGPLAPATPATTSADSSPPGDDASADHRGNDERADAGDDRLGGDGLTDWSGRSGSGERDDDDSPGDWAIAEPTLREHLMQQLSSTNAAPRDRALVGLLIDELNDDGLLTTPLDDILALCPAQLDVEPAELSTALALLQSFDPAGVGARSLGESLRLQLDALAAGRGRRGDRPPERATIVLARLIVSEHLQLLAARDFAKLRKVLGADDDGLRAAHQLIRGLNPRPGVGFGGRTADYVVPDIVVRRVKGLWVAQLNPSVVPQLRINQAYAAIVKRERQQEGTASWSNRLQEARWLIRNLHQRFETILRVSQAIVDRQHSFFTHGPIAMRPLVLREIAETMGLHESTISRVTASKYMATPLGVFELKYFFGSHVATDTGGAASSTAIRALIKQLIGAENPKSPLSDSRLAELLGEQGIVVARRTVAKYREMLDVPPVALRKAL